MPLDVHALIAGLALRHGVADVPRLSRVADDISQASVEPVFCGSRAADALSVTLIAIAEHESGWQERVQTCAYSVDSQYSLWQLKGSVSMGGHTKTEVCSDDALAASLAAKVLMRVRRCGSVECMMRGYASGNTLVRSRAATELSNLVFGLVWGAGIILRYRNGCLSAESR